MTNDFLAQHLAVCSWSLQPVSPQDLVAKLQATGIRRVQIALDPLRQDPGLWGKTKALLDRGGLEMASGMFGCVGEDYSTPQSIRLTGGIAPEATWAQNWKDIQAVAALAGQLGLKFVTFHAGFLPEDAGDPNFAKMRQRLVQVADAFAARKVMLGLETGQETASLLLRWLQEINHPALGINFDPANMILYNQDEPLAAMRALGFWVRQVHIKDAVHTKVPGNWGEEVTVGCGEVDWRAFFGILRGLNFSGDLVIEREAGNQRLADVRTAREIIEKEFFAADMAGKNKRMPASGIHLSGVPQP